MLEYYRKGIVVPDNLLRALVPGGGRIIKANLFLDFISQQKDLGKAYLYINDSS